MTHGQIRNKTSAKALGAAVAITPLLVAGAHADDAQAKTFKVKNKRSHGKGSLNKAIKKANRNKGSDRIIFRSRLSGDIKVRRGKKRRLQVTDPIKIVGPGRRLALKGPTKGGLLSFRGSGKSVVKGMKLKAVSIDADGSGDGVDLRLISSTLTGKGIDASGVRVRDSDSSISSFTISRTEIAHFGTGVTAFYADGRIDRSTIRKNFPDGGVYAGYYGTVDITKSTISGNRSSSRRPATGHPAGGGVYAYAAGGASISNSTISGNSAVRDGARGGGVYGFVDVTASTITKNFAPVGAGIYTPGVDGPFPRVARIDNSIIADNQAFVSEDCGGGGQRSGGGNVFGSPGCGDPAAGDVVAANPRLGPLDDNGGPTETRPLLKGSPAINRASGLKLKTDQRGVRRGKHPDSGAFERR